MNLMSYSGNKVKMLMTPPLREFTSSQVYNPLKAMSIFSKRCSGIFALTCTVMLLSIGFSTPVWSQDPQPYTPKVAGTIRNCAEVSAAGTTDPDSTPGNYDDTKPDGTSANEEDDNACVNIPAFDLAIKKLLATGQASSVIPGDNVIFTLTVYNQGAFDAANVVITDYIDPVKFDCTASAALTNTGWTFDCASNRATYTLATLAKATAADMPDGKASSGINITLKTRITATGNATNDTEISDDRVVDPNFGAAPQAVTDIDSRPDQDDTNDGTTKDNTFTESRLNPDGSVKDANADEDDRDPAQVAFGSIFDLALDKKLKSGVTGPFIPGGNVTFTITVYNQGGAVASNIQLTDYIPTGLTLNDPNWTAVAGKATLNAPISSLAAGASTTVDINFTIDPTATGTLVNKAEISAATGGTDIDSTPDNTDGNQPGEVTPKDNVVTEDGKNGGDEDDHDPAQITLTPIYDLALVKTLAAGQSATVVQGQNVNYVITVKNQGQVASGSFTVTDQVPGGMSFVSASGAGFVCNQGSPGIVTCTNAAGIAVGATAAINMVLKLDDATKGPFRNWSEISLDSGDDIDSTPDSNTGKDDLAGTGTDPNDLVNNTNNIDYPGADDEDDNDFEDIVGVQQYDLALRKTLAAGQATTVNQGDNVDYLITVFNQGQAPSGAFSITDQLPSGTQYVSATGTGFVCGPTGQVLTCNFTSSLNAGDQAQINLRLKVTDATQSVLRNWSEISLDSGDDIDSTPDTNVGLDNGPGTGTDPNDGSVTGGTVKDDEINEDHKANPGQDEDDNDYADVTVNPVFDLALKKTLAASQAATVAPGDNVTFTITVTNQGQAPATNIQLIDYIPADMTLNDPSWAASGANATRTIAGPLAAGASTTVDVILRVKPTAPTGALTNYAEISAATGGTDIDSTPDTTPSNDVGGVPNSNTDDLIISTPTGTPPDEDDHDPAQVNVAPPAIFDLALKKTLALSQVTTVAQGDNVKFTIMVVNQGSVTAQNITVTDYIPTGMSLSDAAWTAGAGNTASIVIPGPLAMGAMTSVDITLKVDNATAAGTLVNYAEISRAENLAGATPTDVDSTPDTNRSNDTGGVPGSSTDDKLDDNKPVADPTKVDEDDHDPATITVITMSLGNRVWYDINNNGLEDPTEQGIPNVMVTLYKDANVDGTPDGAAVGTTTTNTQGYYIFTGLMPSTYIVEVMPPSGYTSSTPDGGDPDNNTDIDDNGMILVGGKIRSLPITIELNGEPTGDLLGTVTDTTPDNNSNYTVDFGLWQPMSLGNRVWLDLNNNGIMEPTENGLGNVVVNLYRDSNKDESPDSPTPISTATTNATGYYLFTNLPEDTYIVEILPPAGYFSSTTDGGDPDTDADDNDDNGSNLVNGVIRAPNVMLMAGGEPTGEPATPGFSDSTPDGNANYTVDFGLWKPMSLGNHVWYDRDNNGKFDNGEVGVPTVVVNLYTDTNGDGNKDGAAVKTTGTNAQGYYLFTNLTPDNYIVEIVAPAGYISSLPDAGDPDSDADDADDNGIGNAGGNIMSAPITLAYNTEPTGEGATPGLADSVADIDANYTLDFGIYRPVSIGNHVWEDRNNNGLKDGTEPGVANVPVSLYRDSNNDGLPDSAAIASMNTNSQGFYLFKDIGEDTYIVQIDMPLNYKSSTPDAGDPDVDRDDMDDNGVVLVGSASVRSHPVTLIAGTQPGGEGATPGIADTTPDASANYTVDFGIYQPFNIVVTKKADRTRVGVGQNVTFTITATNQGPGTAYAAQVEEKLPAGLQYVSHSTSTGTYTTGTGIWAIGNMAPLSTQTMTIVTKVLARGPYKNVARCITCGDDDTKDEDDDDDETITPDSTADLRIFKIVDRGTAEPGDLLTYTITIQNVGAANATKAVLRDPAVAISLTAPQYSIDGGAFAAWPASGVVNLPDPILPNQTISVVIRGAIPESQRGKVIENIAEVDSPDDPTGPDTSIPVKTCIGVPNLHIEKVVDKNAANVGDEIVYTLTVTNDGNAAVTTLTVSDAGALSLDNPTFVMSGDATGSGNWTGFITPTTFTGGGFAPGDVITIIIRGRVNAAWQGRNIENIAKVSSPQDPQGEKPSTRTDTAIGSPDLNITKTVDKAAARVGDSITYTIRVRNDGTSAATGVTINDPTAATLGTPTYTLAGDATGSGTWTGTINPSLTGGTLAAGETITLTITGTVTADFQGRVIENVAEATAPNDPTGPVKTPPVVTNVGTADLVAVKTVNKTSAQVGDTIIYTITVRNEGTSPATSVTVTDGGALSLQTPTYTVGGDATGSGNWGGSVTLNTFTGGGLATGESITVTIQGTVTATFQGRAIVNTAQATSPQDPSGPVSTDPVETVIGTAKLIATKTVDLAAAKPGDQIRYTIVVRNEGASPASTVTVTDAVATNLTNPTYNIVGDASGSGIWQGSFTVTSFIGGNLAPSESFTLTITGTIPTTAQSSVISNTATVYSPQDPSGPTTTAPVTTTIGAADLSATKSVDKQAAKPGDTLTYTIIVKNDGPAMATNVTVADTNALILTNPTYTLTGDVTGTGAWAGAVTVTSAQFAGNGLASGESFSVTITGTVPQTALGTNISNIATISSPQDPTGPIQTAPVNTSVGTANLSASKSVDKQAAKPGDTLTYTILVRNNGASGATQVVVDDATASALSNPTYTVAGDATGNGNWTGAVTVTNFIGGGLGQNESITVTITGTVPASAQGTVINNVATVSSPQDPNGPIKTAPVTTTVGTADLTAVKTVNRQTAKPGDALTYTLTITNNGLANANEVTVQDPTAAQLTSSTYTVVGGTPASGAWTGSLIITPTGGLTTGETMTVTITGTVPNTALGTKITNIATVSSPQDPTSPITTAPVETAVGTADLTATKRADKTAAQVGDTITYTITVTNEGNADARSVTVADNTALQLTNPTFTVSGDAAAASAPWTGASTITSFVGGGLATGELVVVTITGTVPASLQGRTLDNVAQVSSPQDPTGTINTPVAQTVIGAAKLTVAKQVDRDMAAPGDVLTYTITVNNVGTSAASNVQVTDVLATTLAGATYSVNAGPSAAWPTNGSITLASPIPAGGSAVVTIRGTIQASQLGKMLENTAQVASASDPTGATTSNPVRTAVGTADLNAMKTVNKAAAQVGDALTYTITVRNDGMAAATTVNLTDANALALTNPTYTLSGDATGSGNWAGSLAVTTFTGGGLAPGEVITLAITGTVPQTAVGTVMNNVATASSPQDPTGTVQTPVVSTVINTADLMASKTVDKVAAKPGDNVTYTIVVTNQGNAQATAVTVNDQGALQLTNPTFTVSGDATAASAVWSGATTLTTFTGGGLAPNEAITLTITGTVPQALQGSVLKNVAVASSPQDPTGPLTTNEVTTVIGTAKLIASKAVDKTAAKAGDVLTYTITVKNDGTANANTVTINDAQALTLSSPVYVLGGDAAGTGAWTGVLTVSSFTGGGLAVGESVTVTISGTVPQTAQGSVIENTATVNSPQDPTGAVTTNKVTTTIGTARLAITKVVDKAAAKPGENVTYTISVRNDGTAAANTITVDDPDALALAATTYTVGGDATGLSGAWTGSAVVGAANLTGGNLAPGESFTVRIVGTVPTSLLGTVIKNAATASSPEDPSGQVTTNAVTTSVGTAQLNIVKLVNKTAAQVGESLTYTITVKNEGAANAESVTINDTQALELNAPTYTLAGDATGSGSWSGSLSFVPVGGLAPNETVTLTITGTVRATSQGKAITNIAEASSPQDPRGPIKSLAVSTIVGVADLAISKTVDKVSAKEKDTLTYTLTIRNEGASPTSSLTVTDNVALENTSYSVNGSAPLTPWPGVLTLTGASGTIPAGGTMVITISGTVAANTSGQVIENRAQVSSPDDPTSPVLSNPVQTVIVDESPQLIIDKRLTSVVNNGNGTYNMTFEVAITNTGDVDLNAFQVNDNLQNTFFNVASPVVSLGAITNGAVTFTGTSSGTGGSGSFNSGFNGANDTRLLSNGAVLLEKGTATIRFTVNNVRPQTNGEFTNIATAQGTTPLNETIFAKDDVRFGFGKAQLDVEKQVVEVVDRGNGTYQVTYDIRLMNTGTVRLGNVQVTDDLRATFPSPIAISSVRTLNASSDASLALNGAYTGTGTNTLLQGGASSTMDAGAIATIRMVLTLSGLQSVANRGPFTNNVSANATDLSGPSGTPVSDTDSAVPVYLEDFPVVGLTKKMVSLTGVANGAFDVTYEFTVANLGTVNLDNVQISDDLYNTFVVGQTAPVLNYAVQNVTVVNGGLTASSAYRNNAYNQATGVLVNNPNMLAAGGSLAPGGAATVLMTVRVTPSATFRGPFNNLAYATAESPSGRETADTSNNGPMDPNGNGDPSEVGENNPTPVTFESPAIGIAKTVTNVVNNNNGTYDVTYMMVVRNMGKNVLNSVQVQDNLTSTFRVGQANGATAVQVVGAPTVVNPASNPSALIANGAYNGTSNVNLLVSGTLNPNEIAEILFTVRVTPGGNFGPYNNAAVATGQGPNGSQARDTSNYNPNDPTNPDPDGDGDPTNNNNPTPLTLNEKPVIGIAKEVVGVQGPGQNAQIPAGSFQVIYDVRVKNLGDVDLKNVQITEDLQNTFVGSLTQPVLNWRVVSTTVTQQPTGGSLTVNNAFLNNNYDQGANLLVNDVRVLTAASSTLPKGQSAIVRIVVQVKPTTSFTGPFANSAMASAQGPGNTPTSDISDAGKEPDSNNNGNPFEDGENDPTPVSFEQPLIGIAKTVKGIKLNTDNTTDVTFLFTIQNYGKVVLNNVQITDDMTKAFGAAFVSVVGQPKSLEGTLSVNTTYTGQPNSTILAAGQRLNPGQHDQIEVTVRVNPPLAPAPYYNVAVATGTSPSGSPVRDESQNGRTPDADGDGDPTNNNEPTEVRMQTNIRVWKMADKTNPEIGENIRFTIGVENLGPYPATNVKVSDILPQGLQYQVASVQQGSYDPATGIWNVGSIRVGEGLTMDLTATMTTSQSVVNTACLRSFDQSDPDDSNNCGKAVIIPKQMADLAITKTVDQTRPVVGSTIEYTVTVVNKGPSIATGVQVTDQLQPNLNYVSHTLTDATDSFDPNTGIWKIGTLTLNQTATLKIKAQVLQGPTVTNIATISKADQSDPDPTDNQAIVTTSVGSPQVDLVLVKKANGQTVANVALNEEVNFEIQLTNQGPDDANYIAIQELLPAGIKYVNGSATASSGVYDEASRVWSVRLLPANQSVTLRFKGKAEVKGTVANAVQLTAVNEFDRNPSNNYATAIVCVDCGSRIADLKITKTVDQQIPAQGDEITFSIQVYNAGPNTATNIAVTDLMPRSLTFVSSSDPSYNPATGDNVWNISTLAIDTKATLTIKAKVTGMDPTVNFASVTAMDQRDDTQNVASVTVTPRMNTPRTGADLRATKAVTNATPRVGDQIKFTITVYNDGPENATNVRVKDPLPPGVTLVNTTGGTYDVATGIWSLGTLANGTQAQAEMTVRVDAQGFRENGINAYSDNQDGNPLNNGTYAYWCADCGPIDPADLVLTKAVNNPVPKVGEKIAFTLTLKNQGPNRATGVVVRDLLPASLQYVAGSAQTSSNGLNSSGSFDGQNWTIGIVDQGTELKLQFEATVTKALNVANVALVASSNMPDPTPGFAIVAITPQTSTGTSDLVLNKTVSEQTPMQGAEVEITTRITNNGPSAATNVQVRDILPAGLTYVSDNDASSFNPANGDNIWNVGTLAVGESKEIKVRVVVAGGTNLVDTAVVSQMDQTDPDGPATASVTVKPIVMMPGADMTIDLTTTPNPATSPGTLKYLYTLRNLGSAPATGVTFSTTLPQGVTFKQGSTNPGTEWNCTNSGQNVSCVFLPGSFNGGTTRQVSFDVDVAGGLPNGTNLFANAVVNAGNDTNPSNNYDVETTVVGTAPSGGDMTIAITDSPDVVQAGGNLIYTFFASNVGTQPATGVSFTTTLPAGVSYVTGSANGTNWNCVQDGQKVTCTYTGANFPAGTTSAVTLNTTVSSSLPSGTTLTNTTSIKADRDDNPTNNNAVEATFVGTAVNGADMVIVKEGSAQTVNSPGTLRYIFSLHNIGTQAANGITFTDQLPTGMTLAVGSVQPASEWNCSAQGQIVTCSYLLGSLASNANKVASFDVNVSSGLAQGTQLTNSVTVGAANDANTLNNTSQDVVTVGSVSVGGLNVVKSGPIEVTANGTVAYTVVVSNTGNTTLSNVQVRDTAILTALTGATYSLDGATFNAWPSTASITLTGVLDAGQSRSIYLRGTAPASGTITNIAYASATGVTETASNTVTTTVSGNQNNGYDLAITNTVDRPTPNAGDIVTYTITVRNNGPQAATNVGVAAPVPSGLSYLPFGSAPEFNSGTGFISVGNLGVGETKTYVIKGTVNSNGSTKDTIIYPATVTCGASNVTCADANAANNQAVAVVSPIPCTPANQGGVESSGDQIVALSKALFEWNSMKQARLEASVMKNLILNAGPVATLVEAATIATSAPDGLEVYLPSTGPDNTTRVTSTPSYIINPAVSNANAAYGADYTVNGRRLAAGLVMQTTVDLFKHTKNTCDRLGGSTLASVSTSTINGNSFITSKLAANDMVDCAVNFVAYKTASGYVIDSRFTLPEYKIPAGTTNILTFQVWGTAPQYAEYLTREVIKSLQAEGGTITYLNAPASIGQVPTVYVKNAKYENGNLVLQVENRAGASTMTLSGEVTQVEGGTQQARTWTVNLNPSQSVQTVAIQTGNAFDIRLDVANNANANRDQIYVADGIWTYNANASTNVTFNITPQTTYSELPGYKTLERSIRINGQTSGVAGNNFVSVARYFKPGWGRQSLNVAPGNSTGQGFDQLEFWAQGTGTVELAIKRKSDASWNDLFRTSFTLTAGGKRERLAWSQFKRTAGGTLLPDDLELIAFYIVGNGSTRTTFDMTVGDLRLRNSNRAWGIVPVESEEELPKTISLEQNYPNPFNPTTTISFALPQAANVTLELYDVLGRKVAELARDAFAAGRHEVSFDATSLNSGTYIYRLRVGDTVVSKKMTLMK